MRLRVFCEACERAIDLEGPPLASPARCPGCAREHALAPDPELLAGRPPARCALCGEDRFHLRKHFPRRLGLAIVATAAFLTFTPLVPPSLFFLPLLIASAVDLALYLVLPWKQVCYVCATEYFGPVREGLASFDLEVATACEALRRKRRPIA